LLGFLSKTGFSRALCGTKRDGNLGKIVTDEAAAGYAKTRRIPTLGIPPKQRTYERLNCIELQKSRAIAETHCKRAT
jgi:hypothetical protein